MNDEIINEYYSIIKSKITEGRFESALSSIDKLLYNFPNNANAYYYFGVCHFALNKYDKAETGYSKAINLDITHAKAYFNLGVLYYVQDKLDNALINIAKALILFSKSKEKDCRKRCIQAINYIQNERKLTE